MYFSELFSVFQIPQGNGLSNPLTPTAAIWVQLYKASCAGPG